MSLLDALLLEPYRDPHEVWIAIRTDGQKGSGTIDDPYNGSAISSTVHPARSIPPGGLTKSGTVATVDTSPAAHGFNDGDMVTIVGILTDNPYVGGVGEYYLGTFQIEWVSSTRFTYTMLADPGASVPPGSPQCWKERERFDALMRDTSANVTVHLGPGVFETKGLAANVAGGWVARSGQRIIGSGIGATTLKIVNAFSPYRMHVAIGAFRHLFDANDPAHFLDGFEVADLTIDCNLDGQPISRVGCDAINLSGGGRHIRIRRVRTIHFGSRAPNDTYVESFPFGIATGNFVSPPPTDCVMEDCIVEHPSPNISWNSSIFGFAALGDGVSRYHRGCVLRNNYVNCEIVYGPRVAVQSIGYDSTTRIVTITTVGPHGHSAPGNVSIQGVLLNGSTENAFNGVFAIESLEPISPDTKFTYKVYEGDNPGAVTPSVGAATLIGAPVSGHLLEIARNTDNTDKIVRDGDPPSKTFLVTTVLPHNRTANNSIKINGVVVNGLSANNPGNQFNGTFPVDSVVSKTQFKYTLIGNPPAGTLTFNAAGFAHVGEGHAAFGIDGGTMALMEGNSILHCVTGGSWHDTFSTRDAVVRNNYYHDVREGPHQNWGWYLIAKDCQLTKDSFGVATCDTSPLQHDLVVGQGVRISKAHVGSVLSALFNGTFTITSVSATSFTYQMQGVPTDHADSSPAPEFEGIGQVTNYVIENNVFGLMQSRPGYFAVPAGIIFRIASDPLYNTKIHLFRQVVVRDNVFAQTVLPLGPEYYSILMYSVEKLLMENNVSDVGSSQPIQTYNCPAVAVLNNRNSAGQSIPAYDPETQKSSAGMEALIEDAIILSL